MSLVISKVFTYDTDAGDYIQRVEGASGDNAALEPATRQAINNFVIGCKQDGIWNAIKASCILSGARTLNGALQPLVGTAPTPVAFVSGDYNRKTGLVGNGTSKYLNSNRNNNADPQNSRHIGLHVSTADSIGTTGRQYIGTQDLTGGSVLGRSGTIANLFGALSNESDAAFTGRGAHTGFIGLMRNASASITMRSTSTETTNAIASQTPRNESIFVFARPGSPAQIYTNARLAFYSIGESLDLALLDARVTALITAFGVAIP
jgi:hypothetical protein